MKTAVKKKEGNKGTADDGFAVTAMPQ